MVAGSFACRNDVGVQIPDRAALQGGRGLARGRDRGGRRDRVVLGFVHAVFLAPAALPGAPDPILDCRIERNIIVVCPTGDRIFVCMGYAALLFPIRVRDFGGTRSRSVIIGRTIVDDDTGGVIVPRPIFAAIRERVPSVVDAFVALPVFADSIV